MINKITIRGEKVVKIKPFKELFTSDFNVEIDEKDEDEEEKENSKAAQDLMKMGVQKKVSNWKDLAKCQFKVFFDSISPISSYMRSQLTLSCPELSWYQKAQIVQV